MIYLDYSATTPICVAALEAIKDASSFVGNPNSTHSQGRKIREQIEECGNRILASLNVPGDDIIYTSGATEANNLAIRGCFKALTKKRERTAYHIITTEFEHPSVLEPIKALEEHGVTFEFIKCARGGKIDIEELKKMLKERAQVPFIVKGIMTAESAVKALDAGADAIIVSNHGGRVLADVPATAEVLEEIVDAVGQRTRVIVDGGIRSGIDVFKALALGADACLICRPVLVSYYGAGKEGIECYFDKILSELKDTMYMCGARSISDISRKMIRI